MSTEAINQMVCGDPELSGYYSGATTTVAQTNCIGGGFYYTYPYTYTCHDKTKAAFAVAKKLMVQKLVKADTVEKFIKLVEAIEAEL